MKRIRNIVCLLGASLLVFSAAACGKGSSGANTIDFWYYGDGAMSEAYEAMTEEFNRTKGKELGFEVKAIEKPNAGYTSLIQQSASGSTCADVFVLWDRYFKLWTNLGFLENMESYLKNSSLDLAGIYDGAVSRYRYNAEKNTSNPSDDLYSLPVDSSPTALYYNKTAMEEQGIIVISVDEEDLAAFNAGAEDNEGKTKAEYGITTDVPAQGYYRSRYPYTGGGYNTWIKPTSDEVLIFNNRIPMSWDEIEDLSMLLTKSYNSKSSTTYGYYTEWWFNYGWSVGGDCIEDLTGNGDWEFTLGDEFPNYITVEPVTVNGREYDAGETLEYNDRLTEDHTQVSDEVLELYEEGKLHQLPSQREAFERFVWLGQEKDLGGLAITPEPDLLSVTSKMGYFYYGNVAMMVEQALWISDAVEKIGDDFEWDIAPLPVYKSYDYKMNPDGTKTASVRAEGVQAGHSSTTSLSVWTGSKKKDKAFSFIEWMVGEEGQKVRAEMGYIPNQRELSENYLESLNKPQNAEIFIEAMDYETPGDWWYMPDKNWINEWATALNSKVRNGVMTLDTFFSIYIDVGNEALDRYK